MSEIDTEKQQLLWDIIGAVPRNDGENSIWLSNVYCNFSFLTVSYSLDWKCDRGHIECRSLDEAIEAVKKIYRKVMHYHYEERDKDNDRRPD